MSKNFSDSDQNEKIGLNGNRRDEKYGDYNDCNESHLKRNEREKGENDSEKNRFQKNQIDLSIMHNSERKNGLRNFDANQDKKSENSLVDLLSSKEMT